MIQVTEKFAKQYDGYVSSPNMLSILTTNAGLLVCDDEAPDLFPEIFEGQNFNKIDLSHEDFKPDYTRLELVVDQKYAVYSRTENYYDKTITIVYLVDGEKKEVVQKMDEATVTSNGYTFDMDEKIKEVQTEDIKIDKIKL